MTLYDLESAQNTILGVYLETGSLSEVLDHVSRTAQAPVLILDRNAGLFAFSESAARYLEAQDRQQDVLLSLQVFVREQEQGASEGPGPLFFFPDGRQCCIRRVLKDRSVIGYIGLICDGLTEQRALCITSLANIFLLYLHELSQSLPAADDPRSRILSGLLSGADSPEELRKLAALRGITFPSPYFTAVIRLQLSHFTFRTDIDEIRAFCKRHLHASDAVLYGTDLVFVVPFSHPSEITDSSRADLNSIISQYNTEIYWSNARDSIWDLQKSYLTALHSYETHQMMRTESRNVKFSLTGFYSMIKQLEKHADVRDYIHPIIPLLKKYDEEHKTTFYHTFCVYIRNNLNIGKTLKELYIHRNTFNYHLRRIQELTGIDFNDSEKLFYINCSIHIDRYLEKKKDGR